MRDHDSWRRESEGVLSPGRQEVVRDAARVAAFERKLGIPHGTVSEFEIKYDADTEPDGEVKPMIRVRIRASSIPEWFGSDLETPAVALEVESYSREVGMLMAAASAMVNAALTRALQRDGVGVTTHVGWVRDAGTSS